MDRPTKDGVYLGREGDGRPWIMFGIRGDYYTQGRFFDYAERIRFPKEIIGPLDLDKIAEWWGENERRGDGR